jgi:hypothetical protein
MHVQIPKVFLPQQVKGKSNPCSDLYKSFGIQEIEAPRISDNWQMKVVRSSALRNGRLHPAGSIPGIHSV